MDNKNVEDLSHVLKENEIQLIFNNSLYKYKQIDSVYSGYIINDDDKTVLILPIKKDKGNALEYAEQSNKDGKFHLKIDLAKCKTIPSNVKTIYIRFRIKNIAPQKLLSTLARRNNYLESAFVERQILDFKLNNVRTMDRYDLTNLLGENYKLMRFKTIHLFVMIPSDYEMTIWGNFSECRQLEKEEWKNYLSANEGGTYDDISAYHWKEKAKLSEYVDEFAQLIKMEHKATNKKLIAIYCAIAIILGALGSLVVEIIKWLFSI